MKRDIVYFDDKPEDLLALARLAGVSDRIAEFTDLTQRGAAAAAARANLWVFDFYQDDEQRLNPTPEGVVSNGLSIFQQFRHLSGDARPPAVLISNDLEDALGGAVDLRRRHLVAEQAGVEWISPKQAQGADPIAEIIAIADAVQKLRSVAKDLREAPPAEYVSVLASKALGLASRAAWRAGAVRDVARWRPPTWVEGHSGLKPAGTLAPGVAALRGARELVAWLLRQALPYPSFLVSDAHFALALGVNTENLRASLAAASPLAARAGPLRYQGLLAASHGRRWWAAGVEALAWSLPRGVPERQAALAELFAPTPLGLIGIEDPVVVSDADLVETDEIVPASKCVRAADEFFPPAAPPAWIRIDDARDDKALARKVRPEDQPYLAEDSE